MRVGACRHDEPPDQTDTVVVSLAAYGIVICAQVVCAYLVSTLEAQEGAHLGSPHPRSALWVADRKDHRDVVSSAPDMVSRVLEAESGDACSGKPDSGNGDHC